MSADVQSYPSEGEAACTLPAIGAQFALADLLPSPVTLMLGSIDVTAEAHMWQPMTYPADQATIMFRPASDLTLGNHQASFTYPTAEGPFTVNWSFTAQEMACADTP